MEVSHAGSSGLTTDGKTVVRGIYKLYSTLGIPLEVILEHLKKNNSIPDWPFLLEEMERNGMKRRKILSMLHETLMEVYDKTFCDVVLQRLEQMPAYPNLVEETVREAV